MINLPKWETIQDAYVGDVEKFDGRPISSHSFIVSPADGRAGADTNLVIFGSSGNKYMFYLRSETFNTSRITHSIVDIEVPTQYRTGMNSTTSAAASSSKAGIFL